MVVAYSYNTNKINDILNLKFLTSILKMNAFFGIFRQIMYYAILLNIYKNWWGIFFVLEIFNFEDVRFRPIY